MLTKIDSNTIAAIHLITKLNYEMGPDSNLCGKLGLLCMLISTSTMVAPDVVNGAMLQCMYRGWRSGRTLWVL
jgi:hypothetical protein